MYVNIYEYIPWVGCCGSGGGAATGALRPLLPATAGDVSVAARSVAAAIDRFSNVYGDFVENIWWCCKTLQHTATRFNCN